MTVNKGLLNEHTDPFIVHCLLAPFIALSTDTHNSALFIDFDNVPVQ